MLYSAATVPLDICFQYTKSLGAIIIDVFVDIFFVFDLVLNFRTAYIRFDGSYEIDPAAVRKRYLRSWFAVDLVASIPFDRLALTSQVGVLALAKLPRLLRLSRLLKKLDMLTTARLARVASVLVFFLVFTHFVGGCSRGAGWRACVLRCATALCTRVPCSDGDRRPGWGLRVVHSPLPIPRVRCSDGGPRFAPVHGSVLLVAGRRDTRDARLAVPRGGCDADAARCRLGRPRSWDRAASQRLPDRLAAVAAGSV